MLNKDERLKIFKVLKVFCILGLLPAQVDLARSKLNGSSKRKKCIAVLAYSLFVLHALYKNGGFLYAYFLVPTVPLHQLVIHAVLAMASAMIVFWRYSIYGRDPSLSFAFLNITLHGTTGGPLDPKDGLKKHWRARIREYSMQDLLARGVPYICSLTLLVISATMIYDPTMRLLLYAALPSRLQNWATFGLCLLEEIRFILVMETVVAPAFQLQVISFDLVCSQLRLVIAALERGRQSISSTYRHLRCLQLYVALLNKVNSYLIFTWKLLSISIGIVSGYAAVAHFREHPVFGIAYYVFLADVTFIYTLLYEKAFQIPQLFERAASSALLHNRGLQRGALRRQILSIRPAGIQVGSFHNMERASTLIYINFVVTNIVNMLVAYR